MKKKKSRRPKRPAAPRHDSGYMTPEEIRERFKDDLPRLRVLFRQALANLIVHANALNAREDAEANGRL